MSPYTATSSRHTRTTYWSGPSRWINTALAVIAGFIGLDTLLRLLGANPGNGIVAFVRSVAGIFLAPFQNMFSEQQYLLTAVIAVLGWSLLAALIQAIVRNTGADADRVVREEHIAPPVAEEQVIRRERLVDPDPTRRI
jgi:hypothetical protein